MNFKVYKLFIFVFYIICCSNNFIFAFSCGLHLCSTIDVIEKCRLENQRPFDTLTDEEISYIISGSVVADVGRFSLDKNKLNYYETNLFPASDQMEFISKAKETAVTRNEKLFVFGMELHYWQDDYLPKFSKTVFGLKHRTSYFDYAKYDKWCFYDRKSKKICTTSLNKKNTTFDFKPVYNTIKNIYNYALCWVIDIIQPLLTKNYYSSGNFFKLKNCTNLLVRTYNELLSIDKKLNNRISPEFINASIDTVVGACAVLNSIPFIGLSDCEKINAEKAYDDMQVYLINKIKNYDFKFIMNDVEGTLRK